MGEHDRTDELMMAERDRLRAAIAKASAAEIIVRGRLAANMPFPGRPVDQGDSDWKGCVE